jgi:hypothetical protein
MKSRRFTTILASVVAIAVVALTTATGATASSGAVVIPFEKCAVGPGHYVGPTGNGGTIDLQVTGSWFSGEVQHLTAVVSITDPNGSFTAEVAGIFNFSTGRTVLNGAVTSGSLAGAQVHEEGQLVSFDPLCFVGTLQVMPGSAG